MSTRCLAVTGGGSIAECGRLSQSSWLLVRTIIQSYLLTDWWSFAPNYEWCSLSLSQYTAVA